MKIIGLAFAIFLMASPALAQGYINDRADWLEISEDERVGYVMAVVDRALIPSVTDAYAVADSRALFDCVGDLRLTPNDLIAVVAHSYADPANWSAPPSGILYSGLITQVCPYYVNREREADGLEYRVAGDGKDAGIEANQ